MGIFFEWWDNKSIISYRINNIPTIYKREDNKLRN